MSFSGALRLTGLDDFISPSQACVVPVETLEQRRAERGEVIPASLTKKAQITLHDCLACSGCVTTAEAVLVESQGPEFFRAGAADPAKTLVVSLSGQAIASLAVSAGLSHGEATARLSGLFRRWGARFVFDVASAQDITLLETYAEFAARRGTSRQSAGSSRSGR